jgi:hypothetical protein
LLQTRHAVEIEVSELERRAGAGETRQSADESFLTTLQESIAMRKTIWTAAGVCALVLAAAGPALAQTTTNVLDGVTFNEVLVDPNSASANFDTDNSGAADNDDEFIELINVSASPADISGWEIWDSAFGGLFFAFPGALNSGTTVLAPGARAVVLTNVQDIGTLPTVTAPDLAFDANLTTFMGFGRVDNGGENLALYDPDTDRYIQIAFNGSAEVDFPTAQTGTPPMPLGFSSTAGRVGFFEAWGADADGCAIGRVPDGDANIEEFCAASGGTVLATPGAANVLTPPTAAEGWTIYE